MKLNINLIKVLARRDLRSYFSSPTGYVFITLFIFLSAAAAFWQTGFFRNNLANLDQLNSLFAILLTFFIPALTMSVWSEEKRQGTDELLLTLPATDLEIVLGKYLGSLGIYVISLALSLSHVFVLFWLGSPDVGLLFANYLGYFFLGAALLAVGMLASLITANATIAFVLGALFCSLLVMVDSSRLVLSEAIQGLLGPLGVNEYFQPFSRGVISFSAIFYFLSLTGLALYLNVLLIGRRHWVASAGRYKYSLHQLVRTISLFIAVISINVIIGRASFRIDATAEQMHSLSEQTAQLLSEIPDDRPVLIQAYISAEVPQEYVETRSNLIDKLTEISAVAGDNIQVLINDTEPFSDKAKEAREKFGIYPKQVISSGSARSEVSQLFLGVALTSGVNEEVIPFFDKGLPVEYELVRSIRVATKSKRSRIGVIATEGDIIGGFDFNTMSAKQPWAVLAELKKQYEIVPVNPTEPIVDSLDGLLVFLPSVLSQPELENLGMYMIKGNPTLLLLDPVPVFNLGLSPMIPQVQPNPMAQGQQPPKQKGDVRMFLRGLGIDWDPSQIAWDSYNPHPEFQSVQPEIMFVGERSDNRDAFSEFNVASSSLQEAVFLYAGALRKVPGAPFDFQSLVQTGLLSGVSSWNQVVRRGFFGFGYQLNSNVRRLPTGEKYTVAARVWGQHTGSDPQTGQPYEFDLNLIAIADVDFIGQQFFMLRQRGDKGLNFDNITFFLNCMDQLVEDYSFIKLRKKRVKHRTLETVEAQTRQYIEKRMADERTAESEAERVLKEAQDRLNAKVAEVRNRPDLDEQAKKIMSQNLQEVENRRFEALQSSINADKEAKLMAGKEEMEVEIRAIQSGIKSLAVLIPPIPVLLFGIMIFVRRRKKEYEGALISRRLRS